MKHQMFIKNQEHTQWYKANQPDLDQHSSAFLALDTVLEWRHDPRLTTQTDWLPVLSVMGTVVKVWHVSQIMNSVRQLAQWTMEVVTIRKSFNLLMFSQRNLLLFFNQYVINILLGFHIVHFQNYEQNLENITSLSEEGFNERTAVKSCSFQACRQWKMQSLRCQWTRHPV